MGMLQRYKQWRFQRRLTSGLETLREAWQLDDKDFATLVGSPAQAIDEKSYTNAQALFSFGLSLHEGVEWPDYHESQSITGGLEASVYVFICTTLKAAAAASVPIVAKEMVQGEWTTEGPTAQRLQDLLDTPNAEMSGAQFRALMSMQRDLSGQALITKIRTDGEPSQWQEARESPYFRGAADEYGRPNGLPAALFSHVSGNFGVKRMKHGDRNIAYWKPQNRELPPLRWCDVIPIHTPRPDRPWKGANPFRAAWRDIQTEVSAADYQKYSLDNRGALAGLVTVTGFAAGTDKFKKLQRNFERRFLGSTNAGKHMFIPGDKISYTDLSKSARDLDFMDGRRLTREAICSAFGVPPVLVGILDRATYSNFEQAELSFWKLTMLPFLTNIVDQLNSMLVPEYGDPATLRVGLDLSGVDALWAIFQKRLESAFGMVDRQVPWSIASDVCKLDLPSWDGWEESWIPANTVPARLLLSAPVATTDTEPAVAAPPAVDGVPVSDVQATALNVAQVASLLEVMRAVAAGELDSEAASTLLQVAFPSIDATQAASMISAQQRATVQPTNPAPATGG